MPSRVVFVVIAVLVVLLGVQTYRINRLKADLDVREALSPAALAATNAPSLAHLDGTPSSGDAANAQAADREDDEETLDALFGESKDDDSPQSAADKLVKSLESAAGAEAADKAAKQSAADKKAADKKAAEQREAKAIAARVRDLIEKGDFEAAANLLRESIENGMAMSQSYSALASLYRKMGMQTEEMQLYQDWIAGRPGDPAAHYQLAAAYERQGLTADAARELAQFEQMSGGEVTAYAQAASLYRRLGDRANEGRVLQEWSSQVPNSPDARLAMAQYYLQTGNYSAAVGEYQAATSILPGNAQAHVGLARAYQQAGDMTSAQAELTTAMNLRPQDMSIRLQLGDVYRRGGDPVSAIQVYEGVIQDQPDSREARRAAQAIRRIENRMQRNPKAVG